MFTHREPSALAGGEFFARVTHRVAHTGATPRAAIEAIAAEPSSAGCVRAREGGAGGWLPEW